MTQAGRTGREPTQGAHDTERYWGDIATVDTVRERDGLWRQVCDRLHGDLIGRWLGGANYRRALKTDLFDEALGDGLIPVLMEIAEHVDGMDLSSDVIALARARYPNLDAHPADVCALPFGAARFDCIVSNSTLDHFAERADLDASLKELHRVLTPGGTLLITLDNPSNPVVGLRAKLPFGLLKRLGLVPYFCGATLSRHELMQALQKIGFDIVHETHIMHVPRLPAVRACRAFDAMRGTNRSETVVRIILAFEILGRLPTRGLTGHFVAVLARKPNGDAADAATRA